MQLWIECIDCKGVGGWWTFAGARSTFKRTWTPCEPCEGRGQVPLTRTIGPIDDIEEECTRG